MAIYRPYDSKRRVKRALERGRWHDSYGVILKRDREVVERLFTYLQLRYPWSEEQRDKRNAG